MHKGRLLIAVVVVLGGGYLAAQAYSSAIFDRELSRALDDLDTRGDLRIERDVVDRGWFVSHGEVALTSLIDDWRLTLPYVAKHGLLTTRVEGELQLLFEDEMLFGELLPATPPRWHGEYQSLSQTFDIRLDMAPFGLTADDAEFDFQGLELYLSGEHGDLQLTGSVAPWYIEQAGERLEVGPLQLDSHYRYTVAGEDLVQRDELSLVYLRLVPRLSPEITLQGLDYRGEVRLDSDELTLAGRLSLSEMSVAEQTVLAGELALGLSRLNADGVRALNDALRTLLVSHDRNAPLEDADIEAWGNALEPHLLAMLADSPLLSLELLRVESPLLGFDALIKGQLTFDGDDLAGLTLAELALSDDNPWLARLDGRFVWHDLPRLMALQLGLPLDTDELEILIKRGELSLNGEQPPPLW